MHRIPLAAFLGALAAAPPAARGIRLSPDEGLPSVWTSVAGNASEEARWQESRVAAAPTSGELLRLWDGRLAMLDEAAPVEVSPEVNLRQSLDHAPWPPAPPNKRRWAVCITGQLSRLEIESKVANLLTELKKESDVVDAYLVLDLKANVFVNKDTDYGGNSTCQSDPFSVQELRKRLAPWYKAGLFVKHEDWSKQLQMKRWPWYGIEKRIDRRQRLASHFSQWTHIAACAELVKSKEPRPALYSDILRVREDAIITVPFQAANINKDMGIAVKSTQSWGGLNDKAMYVSRNYLSSAFQRTLQLAWEVNTGQLPPAVAKVMPKIINPERMLALALHGLPVTQLPAEVMVMVDGRCHGPGRRFCLVPKHKDARPANRTLFAPACTLEVEGLAERLHGNHTKRANASAAAANATEEEVSEEDEEESPEGEEGEEGEDAPNMF